MNSKVWVVTNDGNAGSEIEKGIILHGFSCELIPSGEKAIERIWGEIPAFLLLDMDLEGLKGLEVLRILKQDSRTQKLPIISFAKKPSQGEILQAFSLDVDDYLVKPVHPEELIARMKAALNRKEPVRASGGDILSKGKVEVHLMYHRVVCNGKEIKLTRKEFELLVLLLRKEGRILSREYLLGAVWELDGINTRAVDMLVSRLRKKLRKDGHSLIETVQSYGYRIPA